jgi:hypothetical protein
MDNDIQARLMMVGFVPVLGMTEKTLLADCVMVKKGKPYSFGSQNGVHVIYDDKGDPWVRRYHGVDVREILQSIGLMTSHLWTRGAYVPFSHDGGEWKRTVLPGLEKASIDTCVQLMKQTK